MHTSTISIEGGEAQPKLREFLLYFLHLGTLGFGGPIALAGHMQKDLVEERKWVSSQDYVEGLAFLSFPPGHSQRNLRCISVGSGLGRLARRSQEPRLSCRLF